MGLDHEQVEMTTSWVEATWPQRPGPDSAPLAQLPWAVPGPASSADSRFGGKSWGACNI